MRSVGSGGQFCQPRGNTRYVALCSALAALATVLLVATAAADSKGKSKKSEHSHGSSHKGGSSGASGYGSGQSFNSAPNSGSGDNDSDSGSSSGSSSSGKGGSSSTSSSSGQAFRSDGSGRLRLNLADSDGHGTPVALGVSVSNTGATVGASIPIGGRSHHGDKGSSHGGFSIPLSRSEDGQERHAGRGEDRNSITNTLSGRAIKIPLGVGSGRSEPSEAARSASSKLGNSLTGRPAPVRPQAAAGNRGPVAPPAQPTVTDPLQFLRDGAPPPGETRFVPNEVVIGLPSGLPPATLDSLARRHRLERLEEQSIRLTRTTMHRWRISDGRPVSEVIRALQAEAGLRTAQPNYRYKLAQHVDLAAAFAADFSPQYSLVKLRIREAHGIATGARVLIAVIDSPIDVDHPEIAGSIAGRFDAVGVPEPPDAHGTAIAGAIVAHARLTGVAPQAQLLAIRAFKKAEGGAEATSVSVLRGLDWAISRGAKVINMSFSGPEDPEISRAMAVARGKGIVLVAAAGNGGPKAPPQFPAADPNVIAVTAVGPEERLLRLANRGRFVALAAPGVDVLAPAPGGGYQLATGTSIAAAHVSGIAALLLALRPNLGPDAVRAVLTESARDLGSPGRDDLFGAGLADAYKAVTSLPTLTARADRTAAR